MQYTKEIPHQNFINSTFLLKWVWKFSKYLCLNCIKNKTLKNHHLNIEFSLHTGLPS